jgi:hypothetical protein
MVQLMPLLKAETATAEAEAAVAPVVLVVPVVLAVHATLVREADTDGIRRPVQLMPLLKAETATAEVEAAVFLVVLVVHAAPHREADTDKQDAGKGVLVEARILILTFAERPQEEAATGLAVVKVAVSILRFQAELLARRALVEATSAPVKLKEGAADSTLISLHKRLAPQVSEGATKLAVASTAGTTTTTETTTVSINSASVPESTPIALEPYASWRASAWSVKVAKLIAL